MAWMGPNEWRERDGGWEWVDHDKCGGAAWRERQARIVYRCRKLYLMGGDRVMWYVSTRVGLEADRWVRVQCRGQANCVF